MNVDCSLFVNSPWIICGGIENSNQINFQIHTHFVMRRKWWWLPALTFIIWELFEKKKMFLVPNHAQAGSTVSWVPEFIEITCSIYCPVCTKKNCKMICMLTINRFTAATQWINTINKQYYRVSWLSCWPEIEIIDENLVRKMSIVVDRNAENVRANDNGAFHNSIIPYDKLDYQWFFHIHKCIRMHDDRFDDIF